MTITNRICLIASIVFVSGYAAQFAAAQGKGGGKGHADKQSHGEAKSPGKGKDKSPAPSHVEKIAAKEHNKPEDHSAHSTARDKDLKVKDVKVASPGKPDMKMKKARFVYVAPVSVMPQPMRVYALSNKKSHAVAAGALAYAFARGHNNDFRIDERGDHIRILNSGGLALVDLDDRRAEDLGRWRVGVLDDDVRDGAPSFCRSGEGHPVWGRQWCIDKGFGLGAYNDYRWGRTTDVGYITFPRSGIASTLTTAALASLLGENTYDRLALHAVTLGLLEPLTGRWVSQPTGPQMLYVNSGRYPVAELVDTNRDFGLDDLLVALLPWGNL